MDESVNQARAIFYDFFAGLFLGDLLEGREALLKTQLESLATAPLDEGAEKSLAILNFELSVEGGFQKLFKEYDDVFCIPMSGDVVLPYISHFKQGCLNGDILVDIRQTIKELPVRANSDVFRETEDHFGFLFLVMRYCIEAKEFQSAQKEIFQIYIFPYVGAFMEEINTNHKSNLYKEVAVILKSFVEFEKSYIK